MLLPTLTLTLVLACLLVQGCLLFTSVVNTPPQVKIVGSTGAALRGHTVTFSANASDADGGTPTLAWATAPEECKTPLDPSQNAPTTFTSTPGKNTFDVMFAPGAPVTMCLWVKATDPQGATAYDAMTIKSQNRAPVAAIKVLVPTTQTSGGRYPLYSRFRFSAGESSDPDDDAIASRTWTVHYPQAATDATGAPGTVPHLIPCSTTVPNDMIVCLDVVGAAGDWSVELTVSDGMAPSPVEKLTFTVDDDHPPCVAGAAPPPATSPLVVDPATSETLQITQILDDGAPLPTPVDGAHAAPTFAWQMRRNGGAWQAIVGIDDVDALTLVGGSYATGDVVDVTVTISDGVATHLQPACDAACPGGAAGCTQTAKWTVEYR